MDESEKINKASLAEVGDASLSKSQGMALQFDLALPGYRCPICGNKEASLLNQPDKGLTTVHSLHFHGLAPPRDFFKTISVGCNNCGFISNFIEDGILKLAGQNTKPRNSGGNSE